MRGGAPELRPYPELHLPPEVELLHLPRTGRIIRVVDEVRSGQAAAEDPPRILARDPPFRREPG